MPAGTVISVLGPHTITLSQAATSSNATSHATRPKKISDCRPMKIVICQASLTGADPFNATVSFPTYVAPFSLPNGIAGGSAPVKIYANSISLNVNRTNNGGDSSGIVTITGHYELL